MSIEELKGKTLSEIRLDKSNNEIIFIVNDNEKYKMYHSQDCCESVVIDDIIGDMQDLVGSEILLSEEVSSSDFEKEWLSSMPEDDKRWLESYTWTFYKLATIKGYVDIRWYGESNGYYSESVDFKKSKEDGSFVGW